MPVTKALVWKCCWTAPTAPLTTAVSKPNRNPPMAATIDTKIVRELACPWSAPSAWGPEVPAT